ncbi:MAG: LemA family protein [Actinomycetota bacterium]|nr:LemA family protein [Actinomycetota bacterium]
MNVWVYIVIACSSFLLGYAAYTFNRMVSRRNKVRHAWKDIDVQLEKRHQLIPLPVDMADGYSLHERRTLEEVARKRAEAIRASGAGEKGRIEHSLSEDLDRYLLLEEEYPELKADSSFRRLSEGLVEVEGHLAAARKYYNGAVRIYNTYIQSFPQLLPARLLLFRPEEYFQLERDPRGF